MAGWELIAFVLAMGFVSSGLLTAIHASTGGESDQLRLSLGNPVAAIWSFFVCMFAGPYIVLSSAIRYWRKEVLPNAVFGFCVLVSGLWSFCSGILVVQFLALGGLI